MKGKIIDKISQKLMDQMFNQVKGNINNGQYIKILVYVTQAMWEPLTIGVCEQVSNQIKQNFKLW
jgi:ribosome maturation factor RimP